MFGKRHFIFLAGLSILISFLLVGYHVQESWKDRIEQKDRKLCLLKSRLKEVRATSRESAEAHEREIVEKNERLKELKEAHEKEVAEKNEEVNRLRYELTSRQKKRDEKVQRIRQFLEGRGSPMAATAEELVRISESQDISTALLVGIAGVESSFGVHCYGHNPFGYLQAGSGTGLRRYSGWVEGYEAICKFIRSHWGRRGQQINSSFQLRGYCVPDSPWMEKVDAIRKKIE